MDTILVGLIIMVNVAAPVLLLAAGVVFYFVVRRMRRESASLRAAEGNAVALEMEKMRHKASLMLSLAAITVLLGLGVSSFVAGGEGGIIQGVIMVAGVLVGFFFLIKGFSLRKRINTLFKEHFVAVELGKVFSNLHYAPQDILPREELVGLDFFPCTDVVRGGDLIVAEYKGMAFAQCNLFVEEEYTETRSDSDGTSQTETCTRDVFRGRVMRFDFATAFSSVVQVVQKSFPKVKVTSQKDWNRVDTDIADFNNVFNVYAKNAQDAIAILTPQMMEGISYLSKAINSPVSLYYKDQRMYVFLSTSRHVFSISGGKTLQEEQNQLQQDIACITEFLDAMYFKN